jgi:hypothetical protein
MDHHRCGSKNNPECPGFLGGFLRLFALYAVQVCTPGRHGSPFAQIRDDASAKRR